MHFFVVLALLISSSSVIVMPSEIRHDYENQYLVFRGLQSGQNQVYDLQIGKVRAQGWFQKDKKDNEGTLLCLLPNEPRLKPGTYKIEIILDGRGVGQSQIKVSEGPNKPPRGDKALAILIFFTLVVVLIAVIFAIRAAMRE